MSRRTHRSWSQLSSYEQCGEAYRLERIERAPSAPAVWFPAGTAHHSATEAFDRRACEIGLEAAVAEGGWSEDVFLAEFEAELEQARDKAGPDWDGVWRTAGKPTKARPNGQDIDYWLQEGPPMVDKYIAWRLQKASLYDIYRLPNGDPALETELLALFGNKVTVKAFADAVFVDLNTGATIAVDRKTGGRAPSSLDQLGSYKLGFERVYGIPLWYGAYFMARTGLLTNPLSLDEYNDGRLDKRFVAMDRDERAGIYKANVTNLCNWCGVKASCVPFKESQS